MRKPISARRGCAGERAPRLRCHRAGTPRHRVGPPGAPSCSARVPMPLENGFCAMTNRVSPPTALPPPKAERRIMAIWLPRLAVDRWRDAEEGRARGEGEDARSRSEPVALIAETARGSRIVAANDAGRAAGARPGMSLADARTLCPSLKAVPEDAPGDLAFLERLTIWARRWGPWTALDPPDGLLVDVSAVAHLFGGEAELLADVHGRLAAQGLI